MYYFKIIHCQNRLFWKILWYVRVCSYPYCLQQWSM